MPWTKTKFVVLPNEVLCHIFDYLTVVDIIRSFSHFKLRYNDLIRFYVKQIDLTINWKGNRQELKWISDIIQILKVDRYRIHLLSDYQFPTLNSLHLVNVFKWNKIISNMNLKSLSLWFDDNHLSSYDPGKIPRTIVRFFSNIIHNSNSFHENFIQMSISIGSMMDLIEIIERTPNIENLSVTFAYHFDHIGSIRKSFDLTHFDSSPWKFDRLKKLKKISFTTKDVKSKESNNEYLPFNQIEIFIEQCCPDETILKRISIKFDRIKYSNDIWSTINRYKNIFDRFDFYGSFIVYDEDLTHVKIASNDKFDYHTEGDISSYPYHFYIHIYSLPFTFDKLYGFSSCDELSSRTSYISVRHLYFTETHLHDRCLSFEFLSKRMPYLISIDCIAPFNHASANNKIIPALIIDHGIFHHVNDLRFKSYCCDKYCDCQNVLPQLITRMPNLRSLTTFDDAFLRSNNLLPHITQLNLSEWDFKSFDILIQHLPQLTILALSDIKPYIGELSRTVSSLFIKFPSLKLLSFQCSPDRSNERIPYRKMIQESLATAQNMNSHLRHLTLDLECGGIVFYLEN
ncbi:unnamed protein product [Rotaria socialis]|uniref:F-box domain-containing protein n=1 Tax=Rotaria socialis TaxID=392032 RepID=A0A817W6W4_9BILA|nr:unnamed protein product [Rotaria socialis]CAF4861481.1 unnamed protein product [Rotaria socialis]